MSTSHRVACLRLLEPSRPTLPAGTRFVLSKADRTILGRERSCELVLADDLVTRRHCALEWVPGEGWVVEDYGGSNGTFVNGARIRREHLSSGDTLLLGQTTFRFEEEVTPLEFSEEHEAAILDAPDDEGRWLVYADWLQEHQNPLGAQMVARATAHPSLDGIARYVQATWRFGLVTHAVVRRLVDERDRPGRLAARAAGVARVLVEAPAARLLQGLELDVRSLALDEEDVEGVTTQLFTALADARPSALRTVRVGPLDVALSSAEAWAGFNALAAACPRLTTAWEQVSLVPRRAWLEVEDVTEPGTNLAAGQRIPLDPEQPWRLKRDTSSVHLRKSGPWHLQLVRELAGVTRFPVPGFAQGGALTLAVNGQPCDSAFLRGGDVIALAPLARLVFKEE